MLSALRRKPPGVRWANGRMVPSIAELKARQVTHWLRNSMPKSPVQKRSSKAHSRPLSSLAQHRRPLQVNRADNSARAREPTVTTSAAGAFSAVRRLGMDTVACTAQQSTYINHHPSHSPDSCRSSNTGLGVLRRREAGAEMVSNKVPTTSSPGGAAAAAPRAGSGRFAPSALPPQPPHLARGSP